MNEEKKVLTPEEIAKKMHEMPALYLDCTVKELIKDMEKLILEYGEQQYASGHEDGVNGYKFKP